MASPTAKNLRSNLTDTERRLWYRLRKRQCAGFRFRRQMQIGAYVVDFVCLSEKLIVEVDGGQHAEQVDRDAVRTAWLEREGYRVIRFWNNDVLRNTEWVVESIKTALLERLVRCNAPPP